MAHALNLAAQDMCSKNRMMRDVFDIVGEVCKMVKASPKRESMLELIKEKDYAEEQERSSKIKMFCSTRLVNRQISHFLSQFLHHIELNCIILLILSFFPLASDKPVSIIICVGIFLTV